MDASQDKAKAKTNDVWKEAGWTALGAAEILHAQGGDS
jgi:hypothetical protein